MTEAEKGLENLKNFIKVIEKLFLEEKINFDLLLGAGDSGIVMVKITELILEELKIESPKKLVLPFFRFTEKHVPRGDKFDNSSLVGEIKGEISDLKLKNILFVDDEINRARTLIGAIDLLKEANPEVNSPETDLYIIAEDRGFTDELINNLNIKFIPVGEKVDGLNNVILKILPEHLKISLEKEYGEFYPAELACVMLDLPIKEMNDGRPYWSSELLNDVRSKVPSLNNYQNEFEVFIRGFIKLNL